VPVCISEQANSQRRQPVQRSGVICSTLVTLFRIQKGFGSQAR
jgi:hypothetical protein